MKKRFALTGFPAPAGGLDFYEDHAITLPYPYASADIEHKSWILTSVYGDGEQAGHESCNPVEHRSRTALGKALAFTKEKATLALDTLKTFGRRKRRERNHTILDNGGKVGSHVGELLGNAYHFLP